MRRHGLAWVLALPTLALYIAHDPRTVCKMNVWVVPSPSDMAFTELHARWPCPHVHTRVHTHLPQRKHHLLTPTGGACKEPPPPTSSGGDPGTPRALAAPGIMQLSRAWPWPRFVGLPNPLSFALLTGPLNWAGAQKLSVWGHPSAGQPSDPIQGRCPQLCSSLHPQVLGCGCSPA